MCDPLTLGIAVATGVGSKLVSNSESVNAANRDAAARNAVLAQTIGKEKGYAADNAAQLNGNIANYAPTVQGQKLTDAQTSRAGVANGNQTADNSAVPIPAGSPDAASSDLAKRIMAAHDGAVSRAGLNAKVGGYGDTWFNNGLATSEADRNIGVTNNYASGAKSILPALQDDASANVYKPPSIWSTILGGASSVAAGKAGAGGAATAAPAAGGTAGTMMVGGNPYVAFGA